MPMLCCELKVRLDLKNSYIMEDGREAQRLVSKVERHEWVADYLKMHLDGVERVLEVGCGPGHLITSLAEQEPTIYAFGVDQSQARLDASIGLFGIPHNCKLTVGNAYELPFEDNEFHLVYSRLMLQYLKQPQAAIAEMVRVCSPGGKVLLQDLDGQLLWHFPISEDFEVDLNRVIEYIATTGFDPAVGRKLYNFACLAGLRNVAVDIRPYHKIVGPIDSSSREHWKLKLAIALPLIEAALGSRSHAEDFTLRYLEQLDGEASLTYSVQFTVVGQVPSDQSNNPSL